MRNSVFAVIYNAKNIGMAFETSLHYAKHYLTDTTGITLCFFNIVINIHKPIYAAQ